MTAEENLERERRFLVDGREGKPWRTKPSIDIVQHYLENERLHLAGAVLCYDGVELFTLTDQQVSLIENHDGWVARLRKKGNVCIFTSKKGVNADTAYEIEHEVPDSVYRNLLADQPYPFVEKTRYVWEDGQGLQWEIDEFEGALAGLVLAEVELAPNQLIEALPAWVGQEITGLGLLSNRSLAHLMARTD